MGSNKMSQMGNMRLKVSHSLPWLVVDAHIPAAEVEHMEDIRILGRGLMGTVRLTKWKHMEKDLYIAIKAMSKESILAHNDMRHIRNEKNILQSLRSPFTIKLFGTFQDEENVYMMLEYMVGGELFHRLQRKQSFPPQVAKFYAAEIFLAIEHVQSLGFVYRDLKPENVMLDAGGHCKLIDFGFSTTPNSSGMCLTNCGTPAYLSPEQLNGKFTKGYTKVVDWWSFGCLIFELMTGLTPFCKKFHDSAYEIYLRVLKGNISFPGYFDKQAKDLVKSLLRSELQDRLVDPLLIRNVEYFQFEKCTWDDVAARRVYPPFFPVMEERGRFLLFR